MSDNPQKKKLLTCDEVLAVELDIQAELKQTLQHLELENSILKSEYDHVKHQVKCCDKTLERNIEILQNLVDSNRSSLHSSCRQDYSVVSSVKTNDTQVVQPPVLRENNKQYIKQKTAAERKMLETSSNSINLTIIPEERSSQVLSDVYVQLTPLPKPVIDGLLRKISLSNIENESVTNPQFTSTPTVYQLSPVSGEVAAVDSRFISKRTKSRATHSEEFEAGGRLSLQISVQATSSKQRSNDRVTIRRKRIKSEHNQRESCSSNSGSEVSSTTSNEIENNCVSSNNGRPVRQLRHKTPKSFKEPSLNKKMRRT